MEQDHAEVLTVTTESDNQKRAGDLLRDTLKAVANGHIASDKERVTGTERMVAALALFRFEQGSDPLSQGERAFEVLATLSREA